MADETIMQETTAEDTAAQSAAQETTEKTFTQDDLNRVGAKEKAQGERAILTALGLKSKEELAGIQEILTAHNSEKASKMTAADIQKAFDEYKAQAEADTAAALTAAEQARQEAWIAKNGVPDDKADFYLFKINKLMVADDVDFATAAAQYLKDNPVSVGEDKKPPMWGGTGKAAVPAISAEKQAAIDAAKKAMKIYDKKE